MPTSSSSEAAIAVRALSHSYGETQALEGIDLSVHPGEIFGLIGPDGAGKTTTFNLLAGLMPIQQGEVSVLGCSPHQVQPQIGYLTQQFSLYLDLSIDENLAYIAGLRQLSPRLLQERREQYLSLMGLERIGDRLARNLSGGMKQKLALCCALVTQPRVLLLDEPTTGVDPVSRREFWDVLTALGDAGITILVATPYLDEAERCHRLALISEGCIRETGTLSELRQRLGLSRLELRCGDRPRAQTLLTPDLDPHLKDLQSFGDRLDLLTDAPEQTRAAVRRLDLPDLLLGQSLTTLENVFVARLREQQADPPFRPFPGSAAGGPAGQVAIGARNLSRQFGAFQAVRQVDLEIRYGEVYGLLGANGAGKTTTIKMLCGLLPASGGEMRLAGQAQGFRSREVRRRIGYMSQKFTLYDDLSIIENLRFYCGVYEVPRRQRAERIDWVLDICGLTAQVDRLTGSLPGGWKQRVAFGASVLHAPEILFLDEPTSGVDPLARRQFWRLIADFARRGTAILVTTHYLEEAEQCDRLGLMVAGELAAQGSPDAIRAEQPGQLYELRARKPRQALSWLQQALAPGQVSVFGDRLHIALADAAEAAPLQARMQVAGLAWESWRPIPWSLEDCFIGIVNRSEAGHRHREV